MLRSFGKFPIWQSLKCTSIVCKGREKKRYFHKIFKWKSKVSPDFEINQANFCRFWSSNLWITIKGLIKCGIKRFSCKYFPCVCPILMQIWFELPENRDLIPNFISYLINIRFKESQIMVWYLSSKNVCKVQLVLQKAIHDECVRWMLCTEVLNHQSNTKFFPLFSRFPLKKRLFMNYYKSEKKN